MMISDAFASALIKYADYIVFAALIIAAIVALHYLFLRSFLELIAAIIHEASSIQIRPPNLPTINLVSGIITAVFIAIYLISHEVHAGLDYIFSRAPEHNSFPVFGISIFAIMAYFLICMTLCSFLDRQP